MKHHNLCLNLFFNLNSSLLFTSPHTLFNHIFITAAKRQRQLKVNKTI